MLTFVFAVTVFITLYAASGWAFLRWLEWRLNLLNPEQLREFMTRHKNNRHAAYRWLMRVPR